LLVAGIAAKQSESPALKSHHLLNLPVSITEADVVEAFTYVNSAIAEAGYPDAGYRLWKVTGEQAGEYTYLWEGNWPSQSAYDSIHNLSVYTETGTRHQAVFEALMEVEVYNRYVEIPLGN
jgi:hypothetical protein